MSRRDLEMMAQSSELSLQGKPSDDTDSLQQGENGEEQPTPTTS